MKLNNLEYKDYSDQHEGAEYCCVMSDPKIKIYGKHKTDPTKSESGDPHFHIFGEFGETEFYFNVKPFSIIYKDGFKMLDKDVEELHKKLLTACEVASDTTYYSAIYTSWYFENQDN